MDEACPYKASLFTLSEYTVNGKQFPFGITKKKLGIQGSVFYLSQLQLEKLIEVHLQTIDESLDS